MFNLYMITFSMYLEKFCMYLRHEEKIKENENKMKSDIENTQEKGKIRLSASKIGPNQAIQAS